VAPLLGLAKFIYFSQGSPQSFDSHYLLSKRAIRQSAAIKTGETSNSWSPYKIYTRVQSLSYSPKKAFPLKTRLVFKGGNY